MLHVVDDDQSRRLAAAELSVVGTHGRSSIGKLLLGSVTEQLLRESAIDVLAVRPPHSPAPGR